MAKIMVVEGEAGTPYEKRFMFQCPACGNCHGPNHTWGFNGDMDRPTFTPSLLVTSEYGPEDARRKRVCHSFITDGKIQFLSDCTHAMAGQTVEIPDWD